MSESDPIIESTVDMSCVTATDYNLVKDVCAVLASLCRCVAGDSATKISVSLRKAQLYCVMATFSKDCVVNISKGELETLTDVNPLRVVESSVMYNCDGLHVKVTVCGYDHPVTVTETALVRIVKKRRWTPF
eukprot:698837-Rhodomonas_salina.2